MPGTKAARIGEFIGLLIQLIFPLLIVLGLISIVWLFVVGEWGLVVGGIIVAIVFPWVEALVVSPGIGLMLLGQKLAKKRWMVSGMMLGILGAIWQQFVLVIYTYYVTHGMIDNSNHRIVAILFGFLIVMGPLSYMASHEKEEGLGTTLGFLLSLISYLTLGILRIVGVTSMFLAVPILATYMLMVTIAQSEAIYSGFRMAALKE